MKNKLQLIDINIVSAYMGRFLTAIVTVIVLVIAVSALVSRGGIRDHLILVIEVPAPAGEFYEPLRYLLARETGRTVKVRARESEWCNKCELFVLPIKDFIAGQEKRELVPVYSITPTEGRRDAAVLVARRDSWDTGIPAPDDIVFTDPRSVNGCWVQLALLESEGFAAPEKVDSLRFAPSPDDATWVVYAVLFGRFSVGACRQSDVLDLFAKGDARGEELAVVRSIPAIPEVVLACRPADAEYYRNVLKSTAARLADPSSSVKDRSAVDLLKSRGMRSLLPVTQDELDRAIELFERMERRF
jgi:hypothetical protein